MLRRFQIYILWEISKLFLVALTIFTAVIMLSAVVQQLMTQGLGPRAILELVPYVLPMSMQFSLPATLLFAVSSVYGRISADNEVLAVMASGVPPTRVISPTLFAGFVLSLVAVWINDVAISWGQPGINRVIMHSIEQVVYGFLSTQGTYTSNQGLSIHVHGIGEDGRELISPTITTIREGDGNPISISAASARLTMDPQRDVLRIELTDSYLEGDDISVIYPGQRAYEVGLSSATKKGTTQGRAADVPIRDLTTEIRKEKQSIGLTEEMLAAKAAVGIGIGKYDWLDSQETHDSLLEIQGRNSRLRRLRLEPWKRWALGFSCFFFVWVAIPFAIWMRSADHWTSFGACFLPILLVYYPVFAIGVGQAKDGQWSPIAAWLGNGVLLLIGAWWLRKLQRA